MKKNRPHIQNQGVKFTQKNFVSLMRSKKSIFLLASVTFEARELQGKLVLLISSRRIYPQNFAQTIGP